MSRHALPRRFRKTKLRVWVRFFPRDEWPGETGHSRAFCGVLWRAVARCGAGEDCSPMDTTLQVAGGGFDFAWRVGDGQTETFGDVRGQSGTCAAMEAPRTPRGQGAKGWGAEGARGNCSVLRRCVVVAVMAPQSSPASFRAGLLRTADGGVRWKIVGVGEAESRRRKRIGIGLDPAKRQACSGTDLRSTSPHDYQCVFDVSGETIGALTERCPVCRRTTGT
jgi:hypothetical protein